jgi:hypothetical protein
LFVIALFYDWGEAVLSPLCPQLSYCRRKYTHKTFPLSEQHFRLAIVINLLQEFQDKLCDKLLDENHMV